MRRLLEIHALHTLRQVQGILRLAERFDGARLERACARALAAGDGRYQTVRGILERGLEALPLEEPGDGHHEWRISARRRRLH